MTEGRNQPEREESGSLKGAEVGVGRKGTEAGRKGEEGQDRMKVKAKT